MKNKALVISIDSLEDGDLSLLLEYPNFREVLLDYSVSRDVECIYPSYTYPSHGSIITGCYPDRHGIYHNEPFDPERDKTEWFWWERDLKCKTMLEYAADHGLTTASVTWPVTGGSKGDWIIPEIWPQKGEDPDTAFLPSISPKAEEIYRRNRNHLFSLSNPFYPDLFAIGCTIDILREKKPDLMLLHLSALDTSRHSTGEDREKNRKAFAFLDEKMGEIISALKDAGTYSHTTFFILGDHGQKDAECFFSINRVLKDRGYIRDRHDWNIFAHPSSFSAEIYIRDIAKSEAKEALSSIMKDYPEYISRLLSVEETEERFCLSGPFAFVMESQGGTIFLTSYEEEVVIPLEKRKARASHGYSPERGNRTIFLASGPCAAKNMEAEPCRLVDEAPTILSLFGIEMDKADGKSISALLNLPPDRDL